MFKTILLLVYSSSFGLKCFLNDSLQYKKNIYQINGPMAF